MSEKTYLNVRTLVLILFIIYCFPSFTMGEKDELEIIIILGFPGGSDSKEFACNAGNLEKGIPTHSSILAWRIPWTENPGRLQSMGSQRIGHD